MYVLETWVGCIAGQDRTVQDARLGRYLIVPNWGE